MQTITKFHNLCSGSIRVIGATESVFVFDLIIYTVLHWNEKYASAYLFPTTTKGKTTRSE